VISSRGCSSNLTRIAVAGLAGLCTTMVQAVQLDVVRASHEGDRYAVEIDALVDAPEPDVRRLMTDYNHLDRINPSFKVSEILLRRGPGDLRVRTLAEICVWFYCKRIRQVQDVTEAGDGSVTAVVIPELSDFRYAYARLQLWQQPNGTRVLIRGELEPAFWIPPFIGSWLIKRKLLEEAMTTLNNLERVEPLPALPHNSEPHDSP